MQDGAWACGICGADTQAIGSKQGTVKPTLFHLRHCSRCHFSFVSNPWTEYEQVYSADYYAGRGADPLVDYVFELEHPERCIRRYEWRGILRIVESLTRIDPETNWLDFGCGNGGLVRYCLEHKKCRIVGYEEGWIKEKAAAYGIPYLDSKSLETHEGTFDIITAIEVLEHIEKPLEVLKHLRRLLKRGGLLYVTTGNARPFRGRWLSWRYVIPEIHISFYEPETLAQALILAGFQPEFRGFVPGFADVIRFKLLKNLRIRRCSFVDQLLPWSILAPLINRRLGIAGHPIGWASDAPLPMRSPPA